MTNGYDCASPIFYEGNLGQMQCTGGLTKREHFAVMAMQGLCASGFFTDRRMQQESEEVAVTVDFSLAVSAITIADALIDVLNDSHFSETKNQQ